MKILMIASENAALPAAKVGGIGDVLRDLPSALADQGQEVDVLLPAYHHLAQVAGMHSRAHLQVDFAGQSLTVELLRLADRYAPDSRVGLWVVQHPLFAVGEKGSIYHHDAEGPFATDANLFALLCLSALSAVQQQAFGKIDVLHLHDWHAALAALLLRYDQRFESLAELHTVFSIHNLALQGVRPLRDDPSALESWFPQLSYPEEEVRDRHSTNCINLMRTGIRLSDRVHVVSPGYAQEVVRPSDSGRGFFGGEGLQYDLREAQNQGRLHGILNGCVYQKQALVNRSASDIRRLFDSCHALLLNWLSQDTYVKSSHFLALQRLRDLEGQMKETSLLLTSVGRITDQKLALLKYPVGTKVALEALLDRLTGHGVLIMVGSGDPALESFLLKISSRYSNFLYICGYTEQVSDMLYEIGDLFLMPSSFEPCGISQMLAMRAGQPCLVHAVGGLRDTVQDGVDGYCFHGSDPNAQVSDLLDKFQQAMTVFRQDNQQWQMIRQSAHRARFLWRDTARRYIELLYSRSPTATRGRTLQSAMKKVDEISQPSRAAVQPASQAKTDSAQDASQSSVSATAVGKRTTTKTRPAPTTKQTAVKTSAGALSPKVREPTVTPTANDAETTGQDGTKTPKP